MMAPLLSALGVEAEQVVASQILNNGPEWWCFLLDSAETVQHLNPDHLALKKMGVKAGVPDLQLLVPNGLIHGLWIELKSKTGKLQPSQRLMIQRLEEQGYLCKVCFGADEAINEIIIHIRFKEDRQTGSSI